MNYGPSIPYSDYQHIARTARRGAMGVNARGSYIYSDKMVMSVNGEEVGPDGYYILQQDENRMRVGIVMQNSGNDLATQPSVYAKLAEDISVADADPRYSYVIDSLENMVNWERVADLLPGQRRVIWVDLAVPSPEGREALDIMYTSTVDYEPEHYKAMDNDTIRYGLDLRVEPDGLEVSNRTPDRGEEITLSANILHSGLAEVKNPVVRFMRQNEQGELVQIGDDIVIPRMSFEDSVYMATVNCEVTTSEDIWSERYFVMVDPDSAVGEFVESNNIATTTISFGKGNPIHDVVNYPNPFTDYTEFTYVLSYPVEKVSIKVYTLSGRFIKEFPVAPTGSGYNYVGWYGRDSSGDQIGNGTYIYRIVAEVGQRKYEVRKRAVRMR